MVIETAALLIASVLAYAVGHYLAGRVPHKQRRFDDD
jgi:hypothetical protein